MTRRHSLLPAVPPRRRLLRRDQSGAAAVEFALVVGLFVFILYGLIAFGMILALKQSVTAASAEGARAVVGVPDDATTTTVDERLLAARTAVTARLNWLGSKYSTSDVQVSWYDPSTLSCNYTSVPATPPSPATVCVRITYPYSTRPLVPTAPGLGLFTPSTISSEARVKVG